jgi:hypothetical protein
MVHSPPFGRVPESTGGTTMARGWLWIGALGCSEYAVNPEQDKDAGPAPDIVVDPGSLTFDLLSRDDEEVQSFTVRNVGGSTLHVSDVVVATGLSFSVEGEAFELEPEQERDFEVTFAPMGADENYGQVLVLSDDPDTPEAPVDLLGYGAVPELQITPDSYVFGDAPIPCGASVELELRNVGSEDLVITDLEYRSGGLLTFDDNGLEAELPITLAPDESRKAFVVFTPTTIGADTGELEVTSNDPRGVVSADQNGEGSYGEEATEAFTEPGVPPVDVMMLIDNSCSMNEDNIDDVEDGFPAFIDELQQVADWQLIEVTEQDACANGGIITPSTPNPADLLIDNAFNAPFNFWTEALLRQANEALQKTDAGECNEGFLRPGALLHIIILSDEADISPNTPAHWVNEYEAFVASPAHLKISLAGDLSNCGGGSTGYEAAVDLTGGIILDICDANWGANFSDIASEILEGIRTYNLTDPAVPETIVVTVNGTPTTDFDYAAAGNSVTITSPPIGEGDLVEITYAVAAECE